MISHIKKFVFVHINKTGGTSVKYGLKKYSDTSDDIHKFLYLPMSSAGTIEPQSPCRSFVDAPSRPSISSQLIYPTNEYFKFTFVRNPWERLISHYFFIQQRERKTRKVAGISFNEWILGKNFSFKSTLSLYPQLDWITDENGKIGVDFIGRFEKLQEDFNYICDKINVPRQKLTHKKSTSHVFRKPYWKYYNDRTKSVVLNHFKKDIEHFGYEFGR